MSSFLLNSTFCSPWFLRCLFWANKSFPFRSSSCLVHSSCFLSSLTSLISSISSSPNRNKPCQFYKKKKKNSLLVCGQSESLLFVWKTGEEAVFWATVAKCRRGGGEVHRTGRDKTTGLSFTLKQAINTTWVFIWMDVHGLVCIQTLCSFQRPHTPH